jgi:hypothetical protein
VVPEWPKGADCKSAGVSLRWFESIPRHHYNFVSAGVAQLVERHPSKVDVESSSLFARSILKSVKYCSRGSVVEYFLGKEEVTSSILVASSILLWGKVFIVRTLKLGHILAVKIIKVVLNK